MRSDVATDAAERDRVPRATYRIQFNRDFTLAQARELVSYLSDLGVSHIYASPLLKAIPGSTHGYDACNFEELNPEVGTPDDFAPLHAELSRHQMGLVLDVVPNHMGIEGSHNRWWWDVLTHGPASRYAICFDIDWKAADPRLRGKVALPVLGERYDEALRQGAIQLVETESGLALKCGGLNLPVSPESAKTTRGAVTEINKNPEALDEFVQRQHYQPMFWRNGDAALNYRRFFTITTLAGIRIEEPWVFEQAFALVKQWVKNGWVNGLRVDHIDGLREPEQFLRRLREIAPKAWIVVEKILEAEEPLNPRWPVDGTTGYDFLVKLNGAFIDSQGEKPLTDFYKDFTGEQSDYPAIVRAKKQMIIREHLAAETSRLTDLLVEISARHWECRDFNRAQLSDALIELATCIPVYRTYIEGHKKVSQLDVHLVHEVTAEARKQRPELAELFDFLRDLLLLKHRGELENDLVLRFQQWTGPIMAKAVEDTAFYCYARFSALNDVGGDPGRFGLSVAGFHEWCQRQQEHWPASMAATSTHDTKWGGDARARLAVLSEQPQQWIETVRRWSKINEPKRRGSWPDRRTECLFYQALVGAWPLEKDRALAYMQKAAREAKEHTCWTSPVTGYEDALQNFITGAMEDPLFMTEVERFVLPLLDLGWKNSLAQTLVKLTATGVPDIYQGSELWDLSLADPDNRRPVDFALRRRLLDEAKNLSAEEAWRRRESGLPKLWLIRKVLDERSRHPALFGKSGAYEPLPVAGSEASRVLAYLRGGRIAVIVPRLANPPKSGWADTHVKLPAGRWKNVLTDLLADGGLMAELTAGFPVALLLREEEQ